MVDNLSASDHHGEDSSKCSPPDRYDKLVPSSSFGCQEILDCSERNVFENDETNKLDDLEWLVHILCEEKRWEELNALFGSMDAYSTSLLEKLLQKAVEGGTTWNVILALLCIKRSSTSEKRDELEHNSVDDACYRNNFSPASTLRSYFVPSVPSSNRASKKSMRCVLELLQICLTGWKEESSNYGSLNRAISFLLMDDKKCPGRYKTFHPDEIGNDAKDFFLTLFDENVEQTSSSGYHVDPCLASKFSSSIIKTNIYKDIVLSYPSINAVTDTTSMQLVDQFETVLADHNVAQESNFKIFVIAPNNSISSKEELELVIKSEEVTSIHNEVHIFPDVSHNHLPKVDPLSWDNTICLCRERQFSELAHLFGFSVRYNLFEKKLKGLFRHLVDSEVPHGVIWSLLQIRNDHHFMNFYKIATYAPFCLLRSYFLGILSSNRSTLASLITLKLFLLSFYTKTSQGSELLKQPEKVLEALYFILFSPKLKEVEDDDSQRYTVNEEQQSFNAFESLQFLGDSNFRQRHVDRYATIEDDICSIIQSIDKVLQLMDYDDFLFRPKIKTKDHQQENKVNPDSTDHDSKDDLPTCNRIFKIFRSNTEDLFSKGSNIYEYFQPTTGYEPKGDPPKRSKIFELPRLDIYDDGNIFLSCPMLSNSKSHYVCLLHLYYLNFCQALFSVVDFFKLELPLSLDDNLIAVDKKLIVSEDDIRWEKAFRDSVQVLGKSFCQCNESGGAFRRIKDGTPGVEVLKSDHHIQLKKSFQCIPILSPSYSWDFLHHDIDNDIFVMEEDRRDDCNYGFRDALTNASCHTLRLPEVSEETILKLQREKENISAVIDILTDSLRIIEINKTNNLYNYEREHGEKNKEPGLELVLIETSPDSPLLNTTDTVRFDCEHCIVSMIESNENKIIYNFLTLPEETRNTILKEIEEEMGSPNQVSWTDGANVVSACISAAVNLLEQMVSNRVNEVTNEIQAAGDTAKANIKSPCIIPIDEKNAKTVLNYTGRTKRMSQTLKDKSKGIYTGLRDTSVTALVGIGEKLGEAELGKTIIPHRESLEILSAAGNVALSGLGAASIVYEMMLSTTENLAKKSNAVAADVVRHKYGHPAGQVVEDIGEASYNTFRAVKFVSMINQVDMSIAVARNTGKEAKYSNTPLNEHSEVMDLPAYHLPRGSRSDLLHRRSRSDLLHRSRSDSKWADLVYDGNYSYLHQKNRDKIGYDDDSASSFNRSTFSDKAIATAGRTYEVAHAEILHNEKLRMTDSSNTVNQIRRRSRSDYTKTIAKTLPLKGYTINDSHSEKANTISMSVNEQQNFRKQ